MTDTNEYVEHACTLATRGWAILAALTLPTATTEVASAILLVREDTSVPPHHGEPLRDTLRARDGGRLATEYLVVREVSHMFKVVPPDVTGPAAFGYPGETDRRVADGIDRWARSLRAR